VRGVAPRTHGRLWSTNCAGGPSAAHHFAQVAGQRQASRRGILVVCDVLCWVAPQTCHGCLCSALEKAERLQQRGWGSGICVSTSSRSRLAAGNSCWLRSTYAWAH
jgi:hypothetical protein